MVLKRLPKGFQKVSKRYPKGIQKECVCDYGDHYAHGDDYNCDFAYDQDCDYDHYCCHTMTSTVTMTVSTICSREEVICEEGRDLRKCMLGCEDNIGSLDHYCICPTFWRFALTAYPLGLGVLGLSRSRNGFFFMDAGVTDEDKIRMACGIYALHRTIQTARHTVFSGDSHSLLI